MDTTRNCTARGFALLVGPALVVFVSLPADAATVVTRVSP